MTSVIFSGKLQRKPFLHPPVPVVPEALPSGHPYQIKYTAFMRTPATLQEITALLSGFSRPLNGVIPPHNKKMLRQMAEDGSLFALLPDNRTLLSLIVVSEDLMLARALLEQGLDAGTPIVNGHGVLYFVAQLCPPKLASQMTHLFLPHVIARATDSETLQAPLRAAAKRGLWRTTEMLLAAGADPNSLSDQTSPLLEACTPSRASGRKAGHLKTIETLIECGADPDLVVVNGFSARSFLTTNGDTASLQSLLKGTRLRERRLLEKETPGPEVSTGRGLRM